MDETKKLLEALNEKQREAVMQTEGAVGFEFGGNKPVLGTHISFRAGAGL